MRSPVFEKHGRVEPGFTKMIKLMVAKGHVNLVYLVVTQKNEEGYRGTWTCGAWVERD